MDYGDRVVSPYDIDQYFRKVENNKIDKIWHTLVKTLPLYLAKEALYKGYRLVDHPIIDETVAIKFYTIRIHDASRELDTFINKQDWDVMCLKDAA